MNKYRIRAWFLFCCATAWLWHGWPLRADEVNLASARRLRLTGRYEEAQESYLALATDFPLDSVLGVARCQAATGRLDQAIDGLLDFVAKSPDDSMRVQAELAFCFLTRGDHEEAKKWSDLALRQNEKQPQSLWVRAELQRTTGQLEAASNSYSQLAQLAQDMTSRPDADGLGWIGRAIAHEARWKRAARQFDSLVNSFFPRILQTDEAYWPAHLEMGKLFLEKYNQADGARELQAAMKINPRAAAAHVALGQLALQDFGIERASMSADRALQINPNLVEALQLKADIALANLQPAAALSLLAKARKLNPRDEPTQGRLLAVYLRLDGLRSLDQPRSRAATLMAEATERNPHCGRLLEATGHSFHLMRLFPPAAHYYQLAIERLPQLVAARGELGLIQMRLAQESAARQTLEEAFKIDPFNVRVKNTLEVLDLLSSYAVLETEHFVIRFDRAHDELLAKYAARYLEDDVYPDLVKSLAFEPADKTLLEIFSRRGGTSGHSWFSARMVGLPFIGTVGACAGKMFAITSPDDGKAYNWARVLRHEFVHVVNLQQTNFLVPHWFTEALAVRHEQRLYPAEWDAVLATYAAQDQLFDLSSINLGFVRPANSQRWTLAYFQAYLYVEFIQTIGGEESLASMLRAYAEGKSTPETVREVLGKSLADFEDEYRQFLDRRQLQHQSAQAHTQLRSLSTLQKLVASDPKDADALAELAISYEARGATRQARRSAEQALDQDPQQPLASYVLARLLFSVGEDARAWRQIEAGLDRDAPHPRLLAFAADWRLQSGDLDDAEQLYRLGKSKFPADFAWTKGLARVLLAKQDDVGLAKVLPEIADRESDEILVARKLAQLALRRRDYAEAQRWANRALHVDVYDAAGHADLAAAWAGRGRPAEAIEEYRTALRLAPERLVWKQRIKELQRRVRNDSQSTP